MAKTALMFAGQGAQVPGMARDLAREFPAAREVLARADEALGFALTRLMFEGPAAELDRTENAQPAVLAHGVACLRALESLGALEGREVAFVMGLSLGEYGAHVAAGSLAEEDAFRLVRRRGELMEQAARERPGGMASVLGLEGPIVEEACREAGALGVVAAANFNSPGQIAISGETAALRRASELCRAKGAKRVVPLKVSGAFHTAVMAPAREGLAGALAGVEMRPCRVPVLANATARPLAAPEDARRALLDQLTGPVLFEQSVKYLETQGVTEALELGPGKILAGLVGRIAPGIEVRPLGAAGALRAFAG